MTLVDVGLKKATRLIDLAVQAGRKRQSSKTGFVHAFSLDTIPLYENFCFAFALFRQKTAETIAEGSQLVEKLLHFQTEEGNFPTHLHEFPKCWDFHQSLKIAPILIHILRDFASVLKQEFKEKVAKALQKAIIPPKNPLWEHRFLACQGIASPLIKDHLLEWVISQQLIDKNQTFPIPYHADFQLLLSSSLIQEKEGIQPSVLEYALAEKEGFSERLKKDHIHQLQSGVLFPFTTSCEERGDWIRFEDHPLCVWESDGLHSLQFSRGVWQTKDKLLIDLEEPFIQERNDLFEIAAYVDRSDPISIRINGERGMVFYLGDTVSIRSPHRQIDLVFQKEKGEGDFIGHIARGNRANQVACKEEHLYDAFDWQIGLRTLRRSAPVQLSVTVNNLKTG